MTKSPPTVLRRNRHPGDRPATLFRQAGERSVLLEYDTLDADLRLSFSIHAVAQAIRAEEIPGVLEIATGFRSVMVDFDPFALDRENLLDVLLRVDTEAPWEDIVLPSRVIDLPIAFDDQITREAIDRYRAETRADAPNVMNLSNIDYIVKYNGFSDAEEFFGTVLGTQWWCSSIGFVPGLPSMYALDPRTQLSAPKYNPTRMWTPEGAVGIGGPALVVYPMESHGSYQLFGRTVPIIDSQGTAVAESHRIQVGDRVRFTRVSESDLHRLRRDVLEGTYQWQVSDGELRVQEYLESLNEHSSESRRIADRRSAAAAKVAIP